MILGIGVDMAVAARFAAWAGNEALLRRFFGPLELEAVRGARPEEALAARFAAKEAFGKALGTGLAGFALRDVQMERPSGGRPRIRLSGRALERFEALGGADCHVSVSHDGGLAVAVVVIEGRS